MNTPRNSQALTPVRLLVLLVLALIFVSADLILTSAPIRGAGPPVPSKGDPFPAGAVARLGTKRFRFSPNALSVGWSPDGKWIAGSGDRKVWLWDALTGRLVVRGPKPYGDCADTFAFSPDGKWLVAAGALKLDGLWVLNLETMKTRRGKAFSRYQTTSLQFTPDGKSLLAWAGGVRHTFDPGDWSVRKQGKTVGGVISPDGKRFASRRPKDEKIEGEYVIEVWDAATGKRLSLLEGHTKRIQSLAFHPKRNEIASSSWDDTTRIWDVSKRREVRRFPFSCVLAYTSDGKELLTSDEKNGVCAWDTETGKKLRTFKEAVGGRTFAIDPEGKWVAAVCGATVRIYDLATGRPLLPEAGHDATVEGLVFSPDGKRLASRDSGKACILWDLDTRHEMGRLALGRRSYMSNLSSGSMGFSPDGANLYAFGAPGEGEEVVTSVWDWAAGVRKTLLVERAPARRPFAYYNALGVSPDGKVLATAAGYGLQLWSLPAAKELHSIRLGTRPILTAAFSPDGRTLACGTNCRLGDTDPTIQLYDWTTGSFMGTLAGHEREVTVLSFSAGGHLLASSCSSDRMLDPLIKVWEPRAGSLVLSFKAHEGGVACVALSPDGRLIASCGRRFDETVRLWDTFTGKQVAQFEGHRGAVFCVAFSPDGKLLASGGADTTVLLWDVAELTRLAPGRAKESPPHLWDRLADKDAAKGVIAAAELVALGDASAALLAKHMDPAPAVPAATLKRLIAELDDNRFPVRERAEKELAEFGGVAEAALREALKTDLSAQARTTVRSLLSRLGGRNAGGDAVRLSRAVYVLETLGTPEARRLLAKLAGGAPEAALTKEALAAAGRLKKRGVK